MIQQTVGTYRGMTPWVVGKNKYDQKEDYENIFNIIYDHIKSRLKTSVRVEIIIRWKAVL